MNEFCRLQGRIFMGDLWWVLMTEIAVSFLYIASLIRSWNRNGFAALLSCEQHGKNYSLCVTTFRELSLNIHSKIQHSDSFIVVIQRNPPKGQRHFIGQSEPGLHLCLAHLHTWTLFLLYKRDGRATWRCHFMVLHLEKWQKIGLPFWTSKSLPSPDDMEKLQCVLYSSLGPGDHWRKLGQNR